MAREDKQAKETYKVVVDGNERYSIWPADRENARGFSDTGTTGTLAECEAYVEKVKADKRTGGAKQK